ncbi:uncharacterized protein FTOL_02294 [Fusarium torulosum]|uniref:RBR-type E3 ubiquitin transferase n=1 Tax=Fusarium torulosum TaxID=33205 RepID=A0AAE8M1N8_9HYPO|nr:uncharacterized protein FTOL_02294 [Fusarium torulosum]
MEAADYALALSIAQAVEADAALIAALLQEDEQAERDRNFAQRLEQDPGVGPASPPRENAAQDGQLDNETFDTLRLFNIPPPETDTVSPMADDTTTASGDVDVDMDEENEINDGPNPQDPSPGQDINTDHMIDQNEGPGGEQEQEQVEESPESPSVFAPSPPPAACILETAECISCSDELPVSETFEAPCSHKICRTCLGNWIQTSIRDESSFPLKCCGQIIPVAIENPLISEQQFNGYEARKLELETPDRTYCSDTACAAFIPPSSIEADIASCIRCEKETCVKCKSERHPDPCSGLQDDETREVFAMAEVEGWRQCGQCQYMVSLSLGCNHISCRCGFQFCYVCGERWKTCDCPQFQVENLLDRPAEDAAPPQRLVRIGGQAGRRIPCRHINEISEYKTKVSARVMGPDTAWRRNLSERNVYGLMETITVL